MQCLLILILAIVYIATSFFHLLLLHLNKPSAVIQHCYNNSIQPATYTLFLGNALPGCPYLMFFVSVQDMQ